jgi:hypothetical protein
VTDDELRQLFETLRKENAAAHVETREYVDRSAAGTREYVDRSAAGTREYVDRSAAETRQYIDQKTEEMRRHSEVTAERLEGKLELLAESIVRVDEKLDHEAAAIRDEMQRGFADTQAMIKFSHSELDRRMRVLEEGHRNLEETVADLQARIERLESSTH